MVIFLIVNTSFVSALEISNVRTESITQNSAVVKWDTDEPVDSFVEYGTDKTNLRRIGDSNLVREHQIFVSALNQETTYLFSVESNAQEDNNNGNYHSFQTLPPDTVAPALLVSLPEMVQGNKADISGKTEAGVKIKLFLNGNLVRNTEASAWGADGSDVTYSDAIYTGFFNFTAVVLPENVLTTVKVEAEDLFGNKANFDGVIFADSKAPVLSLAEIPAIVAERTIKLNGTVSENSSLEVFVNEKSRKKWEGNIIAQDINLDEGENKIKIVARDPADWETVIEMMVHSDTLPPKVSFELVSGTEYYEGRAETDISGESKAGAKLYLYIFREGESRRKADFGKAVDSVEADAEGKFVFKEVSFPPPPFTSWKDLAPKEVPSGLEDILISPVGQVEQQQRKTYRVFIVAEDNLGRNSFAERKVNINTCFSSQTFDLVPLPQFQAPFRLDPGLMEEGRESIQAVFNLSYRGSALASTDKTGQAVEPYRITQVQFTKACTQDTADSDDYAFGCKLLPGNLKAVPNNARNPSAYFVTADLGSAADFLDKEEDAWGDFKKRQLKFPIKIMIHYNERDATGGFSAAKTDVMCYDLAYFVDVPIESEDMVPDFLVDQGIPALNTTINAIETIKPYLRTAMMVTGISCVGSFLTKMVVRFYRIFISNFEPWKPSGGEESCPSVLEQNKGLYLQSTIDDWDDLKGSGHPDLGNDRNKIPDVMESLDEKCPQTALAWTMEETLDKFYRWTCDRFFCRAVPAGWTADREVAEIETVIQEQKQCTATANCATLEKIENCREFMKRNPTNSEILVEVGDSVGTCYRDSEGYIYYKDPRIQVPELEDRGISKLTGLMKIGEVGRITKPPLLAYQESGSDSFCVAPDISCESMCKRVGGYQAVNDGYRVDLTTGDVEGGSGGTGGDAELGGVTSGLRISPPSTPITGSSEENLGRIIIEETEASALALTPSGELETGRAISIFKNNLFGLALTAPKNSCYKQVSAESNIISFAQGQDMKLVDGSGNQISGKTKIPAGYTKDCLVDAEGARYQCVCDTTQKAALTKLGGTAREAVKKTDNAEEKWDYRQATIFRESNGFSGVYYPKERYYSGRDLSGAFGLSFGLDNFAPKGEEKVAEVNPHTQTFGAFQSLCLPGINARLELLQSILVGLRNCIVEAKYTGLHDAGMCKTIFSQYVCGLVYKGITLLTSSCSPISLKDMDNTGVELEGVEAFTKSAFAAVPQAMDSSIDEVR
ncbi:hypothetical protein HYX12_00180, partial [Candidatus Woesearchaeota archaeon]|nr:hypothetical protein [Candidatus Woesearchaeota archaeon]